MATTKVNSQQVTDYTLNSSLSRQAIINGNFDVWQRGVTFNGVGVGTYTADRWWAVSPSGTVNITRQDISALGLGSQYCIRAERSAGTDRWVIGTNLETDIVKKFLGKTVTLSFLLRKTASLTSNFTVNFRTTNTEAKFGTPIDSSSFSSITNASVTTSFQEFTGSLTIPANSAALGLSIEIQANSMAGAAGVYFEITQVQLCAGDVALPFMPKSYEEELRACQRYCYDVGYLNHIRLVAYTANSMYFTIPTPQLRTTPTISFGTEVTDWQVVTTSVTPHIGFSVSMSGYGSGSCLIQALKTSHGLTDGTLKILTANKNFLTAEL